MAAQARKDFETKNISRNLLAKLYHLYNPSVDTDLFIAEAEKIFPKLNCGLASVYLQNRLQTGVVARGMYAKNSHTFLRVDDSLVVDITADQYGGPRVYVGELQKPWRLSQ